MNHTIRLKNKNRKMSDFNFNMNLDLFHALENVRIKHKDDSEGIYQIKDNEVLLCNITVTKPYMTVAESLDEGHVSFYYFRSCDRFIIKELGDVFDFQLQTLVEEVKLKQSKIDLLAALRA
jgi:hypothetical protein